MLCSAVFANIKRCQNLLNAALKCSVSAAASLRCFAVPPVACWQLFAMPYCLPSNKNFCLFVSFISNPTKMSAASRIRKPRRFILEDCSSKCAFLYVCFFCLFVWSSGCVVWLCVADGAQGNAGGYQECNYKT